MMRPPRKTPSRVIGFTGGTWRSLVAHLHGVQGVPSSNLGVPTNLLFDFPFGLRQDLGSSGPLELSRNSFVHGVKGRSP